MSGLEFGTLGACVSCKAGTTWWYRAGDRYHPVHRSGQCRERLEESVRDLDRVAEAASGLAGRARRGAWARRGLAVGAADTARHGLARGSRYHRPGMVGDGPWVAVMDTNFGQVVVPSDQDREHVLSVSRHWRALAERGLPVNSTGAEASGGGVVDPTGALLEPWGAPVEPGRGRWRSLTRVRDWTACPSCAEVLWPGCLTLIGEGVCVSCAAATEAGDPRVWPSEPVDPGRGAWPERLGGGKPRRARPAAARHEAGDARQGGASTVVPVVGGLFGDSPELS